MRILFPQDPLKAAVADGPFVDEKAACERLGIACSLFDFDALAHAPLKPRPAIDAGEQILYRGWMLKPADYAVLTQKIERGGGIPVTSAANYALSHHIDGWYDACRDLTPKTVLLRSDDD
ncbi:MAG: hypothetical protein AAFU65_00230, partial [Pseudomonadota bacterium]